MKNFKKISKIVGIIMLLLVFWCSGVLVRYVFAISADKGDFVTLGREATDATGHKEIQDEKILLWARPGINDTVQARIKSCTVVLALDKTVVQGKNFYMVSTVGKDGGMMGWVSEDYIYDITTEPPRE